MYCATLQNYIIQQTFAHSTPTSRIFCHSRWEHEPRRNFRRMGFAFLRALSCEYTFTALIRLNASVKSAT